MPYTGTWIRGQVPYSGAQVWGTGINPVHEIYGSYPARQEPIQLEHGEVTPPGQSVPEAIVNPEQWGYTLDDQANTSVCYDDRPAWNEQPDQFRGDADGQPPWSAPQSVNENFRAKPGGAFRLIRGRFPRMNYEEPSETVSEGWQNKPEGTPADAKPSDPSQYEMQTSMTQRYRERVNDQATARETDYSRTGIGSRVRGQKLKKYSGELRHYDMFPRQQTPGMVRPFSYRTAGTGAVRWMRPNAMFDQYPLQRNPPPDPYLGETVDNLTEGYGYTPEDVFY